MRKIENILLALLLLTSFFVRLYKFDSPIADWHSWRQADTSSVSRSFLNYGFDLLHPKYHDLSNIPSGIDNPNGYRFVEFPLYNLTQAGMYKIFAIFSLEQWGRLITIFSAVIATLFLYLIVKKHSDVIVALFTAFFYALLPFNVYFGRTILPDQSMVTAILGGIYFFGRFLEIDRRDFKINKYFFYILSIIFTATAYLLKPHALFFTLPMVYIAWRKYRFKIFIQWHLWLFLAFSLMPFIWWRWWMLRYPEGIPSNLWLFNGGNIRFTGAFFYWLFADRLSRLILGYWGLVLFVIGLLINSSRERLRKDGIYFYIFLLSMLIYLTVLARGNVQHDYYQILIIPTVAIFMGLGARVLLLPHPDFINKTISRSLLIVIILFTLGFSWYHVRDYYNINNPSILIAGRVADKLLPKDAKVVAPMEGDTTLLYYTNRNGWPSFQHPLPELISKGATHLILLNPTGKDLDIGKEYKIIANAKEYLIFDLRSKL